MTSHMINSFVNRAETKQAGIDDTQSTPEPSASSVNVDGGAVGHNTNGLPSVWTYSEECTFCRIISGEGNAYKIYEDESMICILDILPIRPGHVLVIPKRHVSRLSDLDDELAGNVGRLVSRVAKALTIALDNTALNVVCNQEYAQAVPHVHYHIVPAPKLSDSNTLSISGAASYHAMLQAEFDMREELDSDDAQKLLQRIKTRL